MSRRLAVIIGNSEYQDAQLARLVTPGEDANELAAVLRAPEIGGFDEVTTVLNQSAPVVRRAVGRLFADKKPDDLLLLYFSGHGVRDDRGMLYLAVQDTEHDLLAATAIPASFVTEEMDGSRSRRQVLILDCCHSGAFAQGAKGAPGLSVGTGPLFEGTGYGRVVLTATDSTQFAWEGDQIVGQAEISVFTRHLVQGLRTGQADTDADGRITLDELYDYVYEQVVLQTPKQTPRKFTYNQQGDVIIANNPRPVVARPAELPEELRQAMQSALGGVREGAVLELKHVLYSNQKALVEPAIAALRLMEGDDSRRVASAATAALTAYRQARQLAEAADAERRARAAAPPPAVAPQPLPPVVLPAPKPAPEPHAEQARLAGERAEQERRLRAQAEAEQPKKRVVPPVAVPAQRLPPPELKRAAQTGEMLRASANALAANTAEIAAGSSGAVWLAIACAGFGLGVAWMAGASTYSLIYGDSDSHNLYLVAIAAAWIVNNVIGGLIIGLILRLMRSTYRWVYIPALMLAWGFAGGVGWAVWGFVSDNVGSSLGNLAGSAMTGLLVGAVTALTIWIEVKPVPWGRSMVTIAGWILAHELASLADILFGWNSGQGYLLGAITGLIGSAVMFWSLRPSRRRSA